MSLKLIVFLVFAIYAGLILFPLAAFVLSELRALFRQLMGLPTEEAADREPYRLAK